MLADIAIGAHKRLKRMRFWRDEEGSMVVFSLFVMLMMLMAGGVAVDVMRTEYTRVTIQQTLDRAVLAAANLDQEGEAVQVVNDYFDKAGIGSYLDQSSISVSTSGENGEVIYREVSASASKDVRSFFMHMLGIDSLLAAGTSAAEEGIGSLEISLVVDVSESMSDPSSSGNTKLWQLQDAAKDFAWHMLCNPHAERNSASNCSVTPGTVSISLVPYAEQVVAGEALLNGFNDDTGVVGNGEYDITDEHLSSHCVTFDEEDFNTPFLSVSEEVKRTGQFDPWSTDDSPSEFVCLTDDWRTIRPFVGHHSNLNHLINNLRAGGNTSIDVGMKWGTLLLDPSARDVIAGLATEDRVGGATATEPDFTGRPFDYDSKKSMKVVVLMSDGENTDQHYLKDAYRADLSPVWRYVDNSNKEHYSIYNADTGQYYFTGTDSWQDEPYGLGAAYAYATVKCKGSWHRGKTCTYVTEEGIVKDGSIAVQMTYHEVWADFTTEWYKSWDWLDAPESQWNYTTKNARLDNICDVAKVNEIIVFTVGYEVTSATSTILRDCASTPGHYYDADGLNLAEVFESIASAINQLRLTQ